MSMHNFVAFGQAGGIGGMSIQNFIALAELDALGVCACIISLLLATRRHWVCAHAQFFCFWKS